MQKLLFKKESRKGTTKSELRKGIWLMRLGKYLSELTKPELEELKEQLNLTDDEEMVFLQLSKGRSNLVVADNCKISLRTVDNKIKAINLKIARLSIHD